MAHLQAMSGPLLTLIFRYKLETAHLQAMGGPLLTPIFRYKLETAHLLFWGHLILFFLHMR